MQEDRDEDEEILDRLADGQDALEEIVRAASERDDKDYLRLLTVRVRKAGGKHYLALTWNADGPPTSSILYAPSGFWTTQWYKGKDKAGRTVWENGLDLEES